MMELSVKFFEGAPKVPLGELIHQRREKAGNADLPVRGVSRDGFINPKQEEADKTKYNVFYLNDFVFNPARMEVNSIALNSEVEKGICSSLYEIFAVDESRVLPEFLNLFVKRDEFARQCQYIGSGSAREYCRVGNISEIKVPLPSIEVQREYVAAYKSLQQLAEQNEALAKPLQKACSSFLSELKAKYPTETLDGFIESCDERNGDRYGLDNLRGVSIEKVFIPTKAAMDGVSLKSYKVVKPDNFCYVPVTSRNGEKITLALNNSENTFICSSAYEVFRVKSTDKLLPAFLFLFFKRNEFDRLARYNSWGSARETFVFSDLSRVKIPVPPIEVQRSIVALYHCAEEARDIAREAREQLKKLAPAMVQRAANTPVEV